MALLRRHLVPAANTDFSAPPRFNVSCLTQRQIFARQYQRSTGRWQYRRRYQFVFAFEDVDCEPARGSNADRRRKLLKLHLPAESFGGA